MGSAGLVDGERSPRQGQTALEDLLCTDHLFVARRPGTAAAVLLSLWVTSAIVLPRLAAMTAEAFHPLPGRDALAPGRLGPVGYFR